MTALTYSANLVRRRDRDRHLATLFAPTSRRPALWALYAFNYEIAKTREVVSDTTLGLIRLQWWRDAFAAIYNGADGPVHEVVRDLREAIRTYDLPREAFDRLLYAREFDLEDQAPGNLQGLENYADFTHSPLLACALQITGETTADVAPLAKAYAMTGLLRAVPFHALQGRCYLPLDLLKAENLTPETLYSGNFTGLEPVIAAVTARISSLLAMQRPQGTQARVMAAQTSIRIAQLRRAEFKVRDPRIALQPPFYELRLWAAAKKWS